MDINFEKLKHWSAMAMLTSSKETVISSEQMDAIAEAFRALEQRAEAAEAKMIPEGWKLVPVQPSWAMISAAIKHHEGDAFLPVSLYKTMLAAAPEPE